MAKMKMDTNEMIMYAAIIAGGIVLGQILITQLEKSEKTSKLVSHLEEYDDEEV